jgi:hypothetical protein
VLEKGRKHITNQNKLSKNTEKTKNKTQEHRITTKLSYNYEHLVDNSIFSLTLGTTNISYNPIINKLKNSYKNIVNANAKTQGTFSILKPRI